MDSPRASATQIKFNLLFLMGRLILIWFAARIGGPREQSNEWNELLFSRRQPAPTKSTLHSINKEKLLIFLFWFHEVDWFLLAINFLLNGLSLLFLIVGGLWAAGRQWLRPKEKTNKQTQFKFKMKDKAKRVKSTIQWKQVDEMKLMELIEWNQCGNWIGWLNGAPSGSAVSSSFIPIDCWPASPLAPQSMEVRPALFFFSSSLSLPSAFIKRRQAESERLIELRKISWICLMGGYGWGPSPLPQPASIPFSIKENSISPPLPSFTNWRKEEEQLELN